MSNNKKLIIGLGNPGPDYDLTRHNIGFMLLDEIAKNNRLRFKYNKNLLGEIATFNLDNPAILLKPHTLMNLSGNSVRRAMDYYKIDISNIIVIVDDLNLNLGVIKLRVKGSDGGHNGLKNIISHLGSNDYKRIRIGISKPANIGGKLDNYVLSRFTKNEINKLKEPFFSATSAIYDFINDKPFLDIMTKYNTPKDETNI